MGGFGDLVNLDAELGYMDPSYGMDFSNFDPTQYYGYGLGMLGGQSEPMYYDTQTGNYVTAAQIQQIPGYENWTAPTATAPSPSLGISGPNQSLTQQPGTGGSWSQILGSLPGALSALGGLGLAGAGIAGAFGAGQTPGAATSTSTSRPTALSDPRVTQLLGQAGTVSPTGGYTGGVGLLGAGNQAALNLQGPSGLLGQQMSAIPQLNPQIQQAIQGNALGFSQGQVPTLNNPQAQQYFGNMLNAQNAAVDYNTTNSLSNAIDQLRQRGFAGGSEIFREGAPAAAMGPILAAAELAKAQNLGNINAQQLQYATSLPTLGSNLNTAQLAAQMQPFNALNQAIGTQAAIPQNLMNSLMNQGNTTTSTSQGPTPSTIQQLGSILPLLGAGGGMIAGATNNGTTNPFAGLYSGIGGLFGGTA